MSGAWVQAVAKWRNVLCTFLVSDKQHNYPTCSTECSMQFWICSCSLMRVRVWTLQLIRNQVIRSLVQTSHTSHNNTAKSLGSHGQGYESHIYFLWKYFLFWHLRAHISLSGLPLSHFRAFLLGFIIFPNRVPKIEQLLVLIKCSFKPPSFHLAEVFQRLHVHHYSS